MVLIEILAETTDGHAKKVMEIADALDATLGKSTTPRAPGPQGAIEYLRARGFEVTPQP